MLSNYVNNVNVISLSVIGVTIADQVAHVPPVGIAAKLQDRAAPAGSEYVLAESYAN